MAERLALDQELGIRVLHYQRRRRHNANYSLEFIFQDVRERLKRVCEIGVREAPALSNGLFKRLWIMLDIARHQQPVTHVTGDINFAILAVRRNAALLTVLDSGFLARTSGLRRWLLRKLWLEWPVRHARKVTTISQASRREIVNLTQCSPDKVVVIHVAISAEFTPHPRSFNGNKPRILHVGTAPNKNLKRLVLAARGIPCQLVIIGSLSAELEALLKETQQDFENLTDLTQAEVIEQYQQCDLLHFASTYEGFGMPILEAQAIGRPVVTSSVASMPEVAGNAASFVDPFDVDSIRQGILRVIHDRPFRENLVREGYENVKRFDPDAIANAYLEIYREMARRLP